MQTRTLGKDSPLEVSAPGLCMGLSFSFGPPTEQGPAVALLRSAVGLGVTFFDTAEAYGINIQGAPISPVLEAATDR